MGFIVFEEEAFNYLDAQLELFVKRMDRIREHTEDKSMSKWLDTQDVCQMLNICPRTVQTLGVSCLESYSARLLQYGEIVAHGVKCKPSLIQAKVHVLTDELLVKFTESHIIRTVAFLDEQSQGQASVMIVGKCAFLFLSNPLFLR